MDGEDTHDLQRFVSAQDRVLGDVLAELAAGAKTSHWMWFVFPQLRGLGRSGTARHYGIASRDEAFAYWRHPMLGPRLVRCCELLAGLEGVTARQVFGSIDELKLCSCLTLFEHVAGAEQPLFAALLDKYYGGRRDAATLRLLGAA